MKQFVADVIELFGFLLSQKIAESPLTPKDTALMARSFPGTYKFIKTPQGYKLSFRTPFYTKFVHEGTRKMKARPFVHNILMSDGEKLLKEAFKITDAKYKNN